MLFFDKIVVAVLNKGQLFSYDHACKKFWEHI